jgi:calcineurin-like phosphoesterase family protein
MGGRNLIFLVSDTHFYHWRIAEYCDRPDGWQTRLVNAWEERVTEEDWVVHLGDFAFARREEEHTLCQSLPGRKILLKGNHDGGVNRMKFVGFERVLIPPDVALFEDKDLGSIAVASVAATDEFYIDREVDYVIYASHYPVYGKIPERDPWGPYFYGHIHNDAGELPVTPGVEGENMCVEVRDYRPWSLPELMETQKQTEK